MGKGLTSPRALQAEILKLAKKPNHFFDLAVRLRDLRDLDPAAFRSLHQDNVIQRRRAYELARIAEAFDGSGISAERLEAIGWTKLAILARHGMKPMAIESYIDLAERASVHMLQAQLATRNDATNTRVVLLRLTPNQYEAYRVCMIAHGAQKAAKGKGLVGQEEALMSLISKAEPSLKGIE